MCDDYSAKAQRGTIFVADDGQNAGLIVLIAKLDHLLVENVAVDPPRQGKGLGRVLLDFAEGYARERGLSELRLYTHEVMAENLVFYPRLGFREYARRSEHGFRRVYFSKQIP